MKDEQIKKIVKRKYGEIAKGSFSCCSADEENIAKMIGYTDKDIDNFSDANLGLGCGNPTAFGKIKNGDVVLDLGSGAGFDCFIAAKKLVI